MESDASRRPTGVRYAVIAVCVAMSLLLYLDRICVSIAEGYIRDDFGLSDEQMSWFLGIFFWTYAIAQVPTGRLSERYGPRVMLAMYIAAWSLFTFALGWTAGFVSLLVMRAGLGIAQAGAYPTSGLIVSRWIPFSGRGSASSLIAFGGRLGGAIAPLATSALILAFTPQGTPVAFTPDQIRDPKALLVALEKARAEEQRKKAAVVLAAALAATPDVDLAALASASPEEQRTRLADWLNRVVKQAEFARVEWRDVIPLEREAVSLLKKPAGTLTPYQSERLNRLALEAALPKMVHRLYGAGWRPTMMVFGAGGLIIAGLFWLIVRDRPALHSGCNEAEQTLIGAPPASVTPPPFPWSAILSNVSLWCMSLGQFATNVGWVLLVTNLPRYLDERFQVPLGERGLMQSVTLVVGIVGMLVGGRLTDVLVPLLGPRWGRSALLSGSKWLAVLAYLACPYLDSAWQVTIAMSVVAMATDLGVGATWAYAQDAGGRFAASVLGWGNMWGNFGAAVAPVLFSRVLSWSGGDWNAVFYACAAACAISGIASMGIDARSRLDVDAAAPK
jgi:ACS family glucarate transporter-like MFS transporter